MKKQKLGEVLRDRGQISLTELAQAVADQVGKIVPLGELLLERGLVDKKDLVCALEAVTHVRYVDCTALTPAQAVLNKLPAHIARKCMAMPIEQQGAELVVVMADPQDLALLDEVKFTAASNISPRLGFRHEIIAAIARAYGGDPDDSAADTSARAQARKAKSEPVDLEFISTSSRQANREAIQEAQAELVHKVTPAVRIVSEVIRAANSKRASDIHIEPQADGVVVRIRVDGLLRDLRREPRNVQNSLISRIKILADMDIAERRAPQDGRFMVRIGTQSIDLRVSTLPTQYGEKVVMRLLNSEAALLELSDLGMPEVVERSMREILSHPQGMLLVTGPTGSGKSTTLYSALNLIRKSMVNIVTVEDPVEYVLPGINQVQVNVKAGFSFASSLRSILRQDPNVIMIGEIRDKETAEIAMKSAQTGHLVLSTLHTNDSVSAVARLLDLGIPGFLISSSITAIFAQRLLRRLCTCSRTVPVSPEDQARFAANGKFPPLERMAIPVGCELCDSTGYRGRIGVYELLPFDDFVRETIRGGTPSESLRGALRTIGVRLMQDDAMEKIREGITSIEELDRVVPRQTTSSLQCTDCLGLIMPSFKYCPHCGASAKKTWVPTGPAEPPKGASRPKPAARVSIPDEPTLTH